MALKKTFQTPHGFEAVDAYHRVEGVTLTSKSTMSYQVRSYKAASGFPHFQDASFTADYDIEQSNPIAQAYAHLKTVPEFADAVSC